MHLYSSSCLGSATVRVLQTIVVDVYYYLFHYMFTFMSSTLIIIYSDGRSTFNPDAVLCPFELQGSCDDPECAYQHLGKTT